MEDIETTSINSYSDIITEKIRNKNFPSKKDVKTGLKIYLKSMIYFWLICAIIKITTLTGAIYYNGYTFSDFVNNKNGVLDISTRLLSGLPVNSTNIDSFNYIIYDANNTLIYDPLTTSNNDGQCDKCHISTDGLNCDYKQSLQLVAFLLSFFIGECGADWFYLARGNCCYICGGVGKLLTFGGIMVWWLVDWIRLLVGTFPDGHHQGLCGFDEM